MIAVTTNKKTKIWFWIFTILFSGLMLFAAIPDIINNKEAQDFMTKVLGYPNYITRFLGVAKVLGVIAILIPGYPRLKEWAYAGLMFDLIGAAYSFYCIKAMGGVAFLMLPIILGTLSYIFYHKVNRAL